MNLLKAEKWILILGGIVILAAGIFFQDGLTIEVLGVFLVCIVLCIPLQKTGVRDRVIFILFCVMVPLSAWNVYSNPEHQSGYQNFMAFADLPKVEHTTPLGEANEYDLDANYRTGLTYTPSLRESGSAMVLENINGLQIGFSLQNDIMPEFYRNLSLNAMNDCKYNGFENKQELDSLFSVKYIVSDQEKILPTDHYQVLKSYDNGYWLLENMLALPLGYTYDKWMYYSDWLKLSDEDRQSVLMNAAVLNDAPKNVNSIEEGFIDSTWNENLEYVVQTADNIVFDGKEFNVKEPNATATFTFENVNEESELYLNIDGLDFQGDKVYSTIYLKADYYDTELLFFTNEHYLYSGRHDFIFSVGYYEKSSNKIEITFVEPGIYNFDQLELIAHSVKDIEQQVQILQEESLEDIEIETNSISGRIALSEPKILCVAVPYSSGWKCNVDGEQVSLSKVNDVFLGIELEPGEHTVKLTYETPYIRVGLAITLCGVIFLLVLIIYRRKQDKNGIE